MSADSPATKADLDALETSLRRDLASKADIVAVRDDFKSAEASLRRDLASKADLGAVESALKADLKGVEDRLDDVRRELKIDIFKTKDSMDRMEERLAALIRGESEKTLERIDAFAGKIEIFERESHTLPKTLDEHGVTIRDHERRIAEIESSQAGR